MSDVRDLPQFPPTRANIRRYIQLHRDTTVQTLTQQPSVEDGRIVHHPSPLVRAVQSGVRAVLFAIGFESVASMITV